MAKAAAKRSFTLNEGDKVQFIKYSEPLKDGDEPLFEKGDIGTVTEQKALSKDSKDPYEEYTVANADGDTESLFYPDEIKAAPAKAAAKTAAKAPAKAAAKKAAPAKAAAKAPAKVRNAAVDDSDQDEDGEDQLVLTDAVASMVEGKSAVEAAHELLDGVSTSYFTLGGVLAHIQVTGAYRDVQIPGERKGTKYEDFVDFCKRELGQEKGKVYQLIRIYRSLSAAGVDEKKFAGIGWTYARAMSNAITADNAEDLLEQAQDMSRDEFEDYVKTTYVKDGTGSTRAATDRIKKVRYGFSVHGDQAETLAKALKQLGKQLNEDDQGILFHHMAVAYLQEQGQTTLEQDKQFFEETHRVTIEVTGKAPAKKAASAKAPAKSAAKAPAKAAAKKAAPAKKKQTVRA